MPTTVVEHPEPQAPRLRKAREDHPLSRGSHQLTVGIGSGDPSAADSAQRARRDSCGDPMLRVPQTQEACRACNSPCLAYRHHETALQIRGPPRRRRLRRHHDGSLSAVDVGESQTSRLCASRAPTSLCGGAHARVSPADPQHPTSIGDSSPIGSHHPRASDGSRISDQGTHLLSTSSSPASPRQDRRSGSDRFVFAGFSESGRIAVKARRLRTGAAGRPRSPRTAASDT